MNNLHFLLIVPFIVIYYFIPKVPQDVEYHNFADQRTMLEIPHFADVVSNIAFFLVGFYGFGVRTVNSFTSNVYFGGVIATCFGSAYYHLNPNNATLVWDRLPMAIVFMSLLSSILEKRVNRFFGNLLVQIIFVMLGIGSVVWWSLYDDLKPYILVQFGSLLYIMYLLYKQRKYRDNHLLNMAILWYVIAKILELFDKQIFVMTSGIISGHTLKHISAAVGALYSGWFIMDGCKDKIDSYDDFV